MTRSQYTPTSVRKLVDKFFSLQWCRDNFVVPLYEETNLPMEKRIIKIAIANYSYLGTIASPIKERLSQSGFKCEFVERSQEEIEDILDLASKERFISGDSIDESQFDEDAVLEAIKETSDNSDDSFSFEFDDDEDCDDTVKLNVKVLNCGKEGQAKILYKNEKEIPRPGIKSLFRRRKPPFLLSDPR